MHLAQGLEGVVFDLDGTLVDSRLDFAAMRRDCGCPEGTGLLEFLDELTDEAERASAEAIIHRHEMAGAAAATWMPGAERLLLRLADLGLPVGVVTRNSRPATELALGSLGAPTMDLVTREDAAPKPSPEGLLKLASHWQVRPSGLAYVGDFRFDLEAAAAAGMLAILYDQARTGDWVEQADHVFGHFDELGQWLFRQA